jgi:heme exporter protein C
VRLREKRIALGFWLLTAVLFLGTISMLVLYTPVEPTMGPIQKIYYVHLPVAIGTFTGALLVFIAGLGYLWQRSLWWDDLAQAAGELTVLLCSVVLLTGMFWAKSAWGHWWEWSAPLTFSLVLWVLYAAALVLRPMIHDPVRRATVAAVYGVAAFVDVPLVYTSLKLMPDRHPTSIALSPSMRLTLLAWFLPVTLMAGGLLVARFGLCRRGRALAEHADVHSHAPPTNGVCP